MPGHLAVSGSCSYCSREWKGASYLVRCSLVIVFSILAQVLPWLVVVGLVVVIVPAAGVATVVAIICVKAGISTFSWLILP